MGLEKHFNLSCGPGTCLKGSANGLLFFHKTSYRYVCNPITRECIKLPEPEGIIHGDDGVVTYGFGVSRLSNHYKVVRIFRDCVPNPDTDSFIGKSACQVFALGTGSWTWRRVAPPCETLLHYSFREMSKFLNGNIHWLVLNSKWIWWISCFDLETEVFTKFRAPEIESGHYDLGLAIGVLRNRLCVTDNSSESEIVIYMLNGYGDENRSWNKEYVISRGPDCDAALYCFPYPVKAFADDDMLMASMYIPLIYYYSNKTKTLEPVDTHDVDGRFAETILYTPSLISLKDF